MSIKWYQKVIWTAIENDLPEILDSKSMRYHFPDRKEEMTTLYVQAHKKWASKFAEKLLSLDGTISQYATSIRKESDEENYRKDMRNARRKMDLEVRKAMQPRLNFDIDRAKNTTWLEEGFTEKKLRHLNENFEMYEWCLFRKWELKRLKKWYKKWRNTSEWRQIWWWFPTYLSSLKKRPRHINLYDISWKPIVHYIFNDENLNKEDQKRYLSRLDKWDFDLDKEYIVETKRYRYIEESRIMNALLVSAEKDNIFMFEQLVSSTLSNNRFPKLYEKIQKKTPSWKESGKYWIDSETEFDEEITITECRSLIHIIAECEDDVKLEEMVDSFCNPISRVWAQPNIAGSIEYKKWAQNSMKEMLIYKNPETQLTWLQTLAKHNHTDLVDQLLEECGCDFYDSNALNIYNHMLTVPEVKISTLTWFHKKLVQHEKNVYFVGMSISPTKERLASRHLPPGNYLFYVSDSKDLRSLRVLNIDTYKWYKILGSKKNKSIDYHRKSPLSLDFCLLPKKTFTRTLTTYFQDYANSLSNSSTKSYEHFFDFPNEENLSDQYSFFVACSYMSSSIQVCIDGGSVEKLKLLLSSGHFFPWGMIDKKHMNALVVSVQTSNNPENQKALIEVLWDADQAFQWWYEKHLNEKTLKQVREIVRKW